MNSKQNLNSIIAGSLIGLGVIINVQTTPPALGALLFSFGLLTIIYLKLPLYTGRVGYLESRLPYIILFNFIGISATFYGYCLSNPAFYETLSLAGTLKLSQSYFHMLFGGIFCGILIHFAVKCKNFLLTIMAVVIFILIGAEHCIADFPYYLTQINLDNTLKLILVIIGSFTETLLSVTLPSALIVIKSSLIRLVNLLSIVFFSSSVYSALFIEKAFFNIFLVVAISSSDNSTPLLT